MKAIIEKKLTELEKMGVVSPKKAKKLIWEKLREIYAENPEVASATGNSSLDVFVSYQETYSFPLLALRNFALQEEDQMKRKFYSVAFEELLERHESDINFLKESGQIRQVWIDFHSEKLQKLMNICHEFHHEEFLFLCHINYKVKRNLWDDSDEARPIHLANHVAGTATMPALKLAGALERHIEKYEHAKMVLLLIEEHYPGGIAALRAIPSPERPSRVKGVIERIEENFPALLEEF